jgi:FtsP/CotA-like multicopper oxidase with cupredoxin domain
MSWSTSRASWLWSTTPRTGSTGWLPVTVHEAQDAPSAAAGEFEVLRRAPELETEREQLDRWLTAAPDKVLALVAQMDDPAAMPAGAGPVTYACPMHPEVTSDEPGRCPKCGMKLLATQAPVATAYACPMHPEVVSDQPGRCPKCGMKLLATAAPTSYVCPMHPEVTSDQPGRCPKCGMKLLSAGSVPTSAATADVAAMDEHGGHAAGHDHGGHHGEGHGTAEGIEWEDDMVEVNRLTTTATMHWKFLDRTSGADSPAINWTFTVGQRVKLRLVNEMDSDHPMHHPFHLHGAGRFLVLARDGWSSRIWSGRTRCWSAPARPWTFCSTCPTRGCGWPIAISPSTCRAA